MLLRWGIYAKFITITGEKRRVPQQQKVKAKNPANSKRGQENQKLVLANGIQRNDLVDENDVKYSDLTTYHALSMPFQVGAFMPYSECSETSNIFKCYIFFILFSRFS